MNKYFFLSIAALTLVSCGDEFLGEGEGTGVKENLDNAIVFTSSSKGLTRADKTGAEAGNLLKNFYVLGTKGTEQTTSPTTTLVFDNYKVSWGANTAGTTADNTDDWKYVGVTPAGLYAGAAAPTSQSVKYWDFSTSQYDFIAYSIGANTLVVDQDGSASATANNVAGSAIKTPTTSASTSFTLKVASVEDLKECYFTDVTEVLKAKYGEPVQLKFKQLAAKVRVAFYETVPGYSVSGIEFYQDASTTKLNADISGNTTATLIGTGFATAGTVTVSYPKVGTTLESDKAYNKASAAVASTGTDATVQQFGTVNYGNAKNITGASANYIGESSSTASMAGTASDSYYTSVFPVSTPNALTLRVNYTLTSDDGSKETIKVYGATAVIPATYATWQPNYAYTYIFKISDNTNGWTYSPDAVSGDATKAGLFPITFDAVVAAVDDVDYNQETITTVATPSVTTYAFNSSTNKVIQAYGNGNEYPAAATTDIYVSVSDVADISSGVLYTVSGVAAPLIGTEAEVIDALQMGTEATGVITGRNGIVLTSASPAADYTSTSIPTEDGKGISVDAKSVAKFTATATSTTYAYVYKVSTGTPSTLYSAENFAASATKPTNFTTDYAKDHLGTAVTDADWDNTNAQVFYKKITNNNNTYAVKVIKTY